MSNLPGALVERQGKPASAVVDLRDPAEARAWLGALREVVLDVAAAGGDATRRPKRRMFSRFEARRRVSAATESALSMLEAAERGLEPGPAV